MQYTKLFQELGKNDAAIAGGKGASLGEMIQNGIPVPTGFVVLAQTFEKFLAETDLVQEIDTILHEVDHNAIHTVEKASRDIQGLIESQIMPKGIQEEILVNFKNLGSQYVAVRSSATAEDGTEHAWAGQLDSYLNTTEENLLQKVQQCWASLFTPRAIFYRFEKGLHGTAISVAVVIQKMVESEISGIAFSVHPVTEDYNQLIIEAGFGLGEAIVSGSVTPDSYVVEKSPRNILDINVSDQSRGLYRDGAAGGNVWQELGARGAEQKLSEEQILELSEIILRIEKHYGFPCDIEWAFEKGKFYIVQSRPITTLTPPAVGAAENITEGESLKESESSSFLQWKKIWSKRQSIRLVESWCFGAFGLQKQHGAAFPKQKIIIENGFGVGYVDEAEYQTMLDHFVNRIKQEGFDAVLSMAEEEYQQFLTYAKNLQAEQLTGLSDAALLEIFNELLAKEDRWMCFMWPVFALDEGLTPVFQEFIAKLSAEEQERVSQLVLTPAKLTAAAQYQADILTTLAKNPSKQEKAQAAETLAKKYQYFPILNLDEELLAPQAVEEQIAKLAQEIKNPQKQLEEEAEQTVKCNAEFLEYIKELAPEEKNIMLAVKQIGYLREYRNDIRQEAYVFVRNLYQEIARRAEVSLGEIIYCTRVEIKDFLESGKALPSADQIAARRNYTEIYCDNVTIKYSYTKTEKREEKTEQLKELRGVKAFKGNVTGRARVILDVVTEGNDFVEGEILVTTTTNLAFVPIIGKAAAIVTEEGGLLTHTAIVARELQKPCVIGTGVATQVIHTGDLVEVDADNGVVRILEKEQSGQANFHREYTRDFSVILEDAWSVGITSLYNEILKEPTPLEVPCVFFMNQGAIEVWDHTETFTRLKESLYQYVAENPNYVPGVIASFREKLATIQGIRKKGGIIEDTKELQAFIQLFFEADKEWTVFYYIANYSQASEETKKACLDLRDIDTSWDDSDFIIRNSLRTIYPELAPYENCILKEEVDNPPSRDILERRFQSMVFISDQFVEITDLHHLPQHYEHFIFNYPKGQIDGNSLKGEVAYGKGQHIGRVRIIRRKDEAHTLQEGEILVSPMTTPDYVEAMKRSKAVVTDEGGITCHAAIVAREFKVPCITGAKVATTFLQDGDLVEVDADNGVVRILEKGSSHGDEFERIEEWDEFHKRTRSPFFSGIGLGGAGIQSPKVTFDHRVKHFGTFHDHVAIEKKEKESLSVKAVQHLKENQNFLLDLMEAGYHQHEEDKKLWQENEKKDYKHLSKGEFLFVFQEYVNTLFSYGVYISLPLFVESFLEEYIKTEFEKRFAKDARDWFQVAVNPVKDGSVLEEEIALLKIAQRKSKNITQHYRRFAWMKNPGFFEEYYTEEYYQERLNTISVKEAKERLVKIETERGEQKKKFKKLLELIRDDVYLTAVVKTANEAVFFRSYRTEMFYSSPYYNQGLLQETGKHLGLAEYKDLVWLYYDEIISLLENGNVANQKVIEDRKNGYGFLSLLDGQYLSWSGKESKQIFTAYQDKQIQHKNSDKVKGTGAFPGKVIGRAVLVADVTELSKVQKGDILVTHATNINFVPVLDKVSAIITEEGGILSHAAIISREMRIPCVIGTKNATKLLNDGDLLEVDADNGVVKILEASKPAGEQRFGLFVHDFNVPLNPWSVLVDVFNVQLPKLTGNKLPYLDNLFVYEKEEALWGPDEKQFAEAAEFFIQKLKKEPQFLDVIVNELEAAFEKTDGYVAGLVSRDLKNLTHKELYQIFREGCDLYAELWIWGMIGQFLEMGEVKMSDVLKEKIRGVLKEFGDAETVFARLMTPRELSKIAEERIAVFELLQEIQNDRELLEKVTKATTFEELPETIQKKLKVITKEYGWLQYYYIGPAATEEYHFNLLKENLCKDATQELQEKENVQKGLVTFQEEVEAKLSAEDRVLTHQLRTISYLKEVRKESQYFINYGLDSWYREVATRFNESPLHCRYILPREYQEILESEKLFPTREILEDRYNLCAYVGIGGEDKLVTGEEARALKDSFRRAKKEESEQKIIKGSVAYPGKVTGRAKLVNTAQDMAKFERGDILISNATTPVLVPAMNKAAAIVTDSGGVTCHAAIVSRELKIPCIVGTKVVTQIIKDGDFVEVDADNGVVRILEKAKEKESINAKIQHLHNGDPWILAEDIPDIDFQFSQIWISFFVNQAANVLGINYTKVLSVYDGYNLKFYLGERDSERVSETILGKIINENFGVDINKNIRVLSDELYDVLDSVTEEYVLSLTDLELSDLFKKQDDVHTRFYEWSWLPNAVDMFHSHFTNHVRNILEKYLSTPVEINKALVNLSFYPEKSFVQDEQESLLKLAILKKNSPQESEEFEKLLNEHFKKYFFLQHLWVGSVATKESYREAVDTILTHSTPEDLLREEERRWQENVVAWEETLQALPLTQEEEDLFSVYSEFAFTKAYRRYAQLYWAYKMDIVCNELAKRFNLSFMEVKFMLPEEIYNSLKNGVSPELRNVLQERTKHCVYYVEKGLDIVAILDKAKPFEKTLPSRAVKDVSEFTGQVACTGLVRGIVKIVNTPKDISKVNEGDILVSIATNPDVLPAMKKAIAFVTEQGGITSHAAIVAREMQKPCIIGTKIATQVLKDGDFVEVDADNGVVRVLEKQEMPKLDFVVTRRYIPFLTDLFMRSYVNKEYYKKLFWHDGIVVRMGYVDDKYYYDKNFRVFAQEVLDNLSTMDRTAVDLFENIYSYGDDLLKNVYQIQNSNFKSEEALFAVFEEIILELEQFCNSLAGLGLQFPITDQLYSILPDSLKNDENIMLLSFPEKENKALIEQKELYLIGVHIQKTKIKEYSNLPTDLKEALVQHGATFGWINARGGSTESWTSEELFSRITQEKERFASKLESLEHARQEIIRKSKKLVKSLNLTQAQQQLIVDAKELVFFRTYRTDTINEAFFVLQPLMKQLAELFNISHKDILQARFEEILSGKIPEKEILEVRKKRYFSLAQDWDTVIFSDDEAEIDRYVEQYIEEEKVDNSELKGSTAYQGKVIGVVRLILTKEDILKIEKGEVLVTMMTTPNMVPAMEKAAGFVTDEGGITCHAAIIAREMKKPCIIGTKIATQVLKDGDLVEVDAENGIVKILQ